ncbi:MAG: deoxyribonuclease IV [Candidatus Aerophobetes bacterium]|nr:deoxyribonuclease IV [Candidatus Aerophobetes bacterium]
MKFGFHISIAGGFSKVLARAKKRECEVIQIFSRNPRVWGNFPISIKEAKKFREDLKRESLLPLSIHMPYLSNLASPDDNLYFRSIRCLCEDLKRSRVLGASFLILHIGRRIDSSEEKAIERFSEGVNKALEEVKNSIKLLLENTAGQGTEIGYKFSQIKAIIDLVSEKKRIGLCLDTAHLFEAGYDLRTKKGVKRTVNELDRLVGLDKLFLLHLNDSKTPLASHSDRHWHIGKGYIGLEGFKSLINHPDLFSLPGIMETPYKREGDDLRNMYVIRSLGKK